MATPLRIEHWALNIDHFIEYSIITIQCSISCHCWSPGHQESGKYHPGENPTKSSENKQGQLTSFTDFTDQFI